MTARRGAIDALRRARRPATPMVAVAAALAFAVGIAVQGRVLLHDCVSSGGAFGSLALRLDVLQDATDCPEGSYALGGVSRGAVVVLSVALPVLLGYLLLTAGGVGLSALVVAGARRTLALLRTVVPRLVSNVAPVPVRHGSLVDVARSLVPRLTVPAGSIQRRGPPLLPA